MRKGRGGEKEKDSVKEEGAGRDETDPEREEEVCEEESHRSAEVPDSDAAPALWMQLASER